MSLHRFFLNTQVLADVADASDFALELAPGDMQHARVLRLAPGERIAVIDAAQNYYVCEVLCAPPGADELRVAISSFEAPTPALFDLTLIAGVGKQGKLDDVIRAATEIGVLRFMPYLSERTVVKLDSKKAASRTERWAAIAKSAAMQSGAAKIAQVDVPKALKDLACELASFDALVVFWEEAPADATLHDALACLATPSDFAEGGARVHEAACHPKKVGCVVGPEGGLSLSEVDFLLASNPNARLVTLGTNILRTETAGVVACALCAYELGGLGRAVAGEAR